MCCFVTVLLFLGPRAAIVVGYLLDTARFNAAMSSTLLACLGFIFMPWTELLYVLVWQPAVGVTGFGWVIVGMGLLLDIISYSGGVRNRRSVPGYPS